jgi:deoxyribonuclease-4
MRLGAHMPITGGVDKAVLRGHEVGCDVIQIFTRSPRQWRPRTLKDDEVMRFQENQRQTGIDPVIAHDCYLINLGSPDEQLWRKSLGVFVEEMGHCEALDIPYLVIHPGSHVGTGEEAGLRRIAQALDEGHSETEGYRVEVILEITAGQGTNLGYNLGQLAQLLALVADDSRLGICFDTCHAFAAGYDLRTREGYEAALQELDKLIGLPRLKCIHLNDAKGDLGSRLDRHEHIGHGSLGLEAFRMLLNDARLKDLPMVLETPKGPEFAEDKENLKVLRSLIA